MSGEKLWVIGPPESAIEFHRLFTDPRKTARIRFSEQERECMAEHQIRVVHQRADEMVYVPAGWLHMVKHLTDTVSFGNSYLRPWRMGALLSYVRTHGAGTTRRSINLPELMRRWESAWWQREWGLSHAQVNEVAQAWATQLRAIARMKPPSFVDKPRRHEEEAGEAKPKKRRRSIPAAVAAIQPTALSAATILQQMQNVSTRSQSSKLVQHC